MLITPDQIRAARALKNWSQTDLATRTGLAVPTIANIEAGKQEPNKTTLLKIGTVFDEAGIEFIGNRGVQKRQQRVATYSGVEGFKAFLDDIYETVKKEGGGEVCLFNAAPDRWITWLGTYWYDSHSKRMEDMKDTLDFKITAKEGEQNFISRGFAVYRWIPAELFDEKAAFYVYGGKVAFLDFQENNVFITSIDQPMAARAMRIVFNSAWEHLALEPGVQK